MVSFGRGTFGLDREGVVEAEGVLPGRIVHFKLKDFEKRQGRYLID